MELSCSLDSESKRATLWVREPSSCSPRNFPPTRSSPRSRRGRDARGVAVVGHGRSDNMSVIGGIPRLDNPRTQRWQGTPTPYLL